MDNIENKSLILNETQLENIANGKHVNHTDDTVVLPSDSTFVMPDKFVGKSTEEIAKSYLELEKKQNPKADVAPEATDVKPADVIPADGTPPPIPTENKAITMELVKEYTAKVLENGGEFSAEMYAELEAKGISKADADTYRDGMSAQQDKEIKDTFTGAETTQEQFAQAGQWARANWNDARVEEFNEAMNEAYASGNKSIQKALIRSLTEAFKTANVPAPQTFHGNTSATPPRTGGYESKTAYINDINNPAYAKDASYRDMVYKKLASSDKNKW